MILLPREEGIEALRVLLGRVQDVPPAAHLPRGPRVHPFVLQEKTLQHPALLVDGLGLLGRGPGPSPRSRDERAQHLLLLAVGRRRPSERTPMKPSRHRATTLPLRQQQHPSSSRRIIWFVMDSPVRSSERQTADDKIESQRLVGNLPLSLSSPSSPPPSSTRWPPVEYFFLSLASFPASFPRPLRAPNAPSKRSMESPRDALSFCLFAYRKIPRRRPPQSLQSPRSPRP
mmetsp:Transcript_4247/g.12425  ORF Transcript_4247/g.12425 Transcript_4247/m.12425 type:complete len:230 (-) Transcript_4247:19-708(-)